MKKKEHLYMRSIVKMTAAVLLMSTLLPMVACADMSEQTESDTVTGTFAGTVTETETEFNPEIEKKNYNCEFNILVGGLFNPNEIVLSQEQSTGDSFDTAIYDRVLKIEDHLGVTCVLAKESGWTTYADPLLRAVTAGDDAYQVFLTAVESTHGTLAGLNCLYDFNDFESINLDAPYWAADVMESISVKNKLFFGYSDLCLTRAKCVVFNKEMLEDNRLDSPYTLVKNKQWTLDKLIDMASGIYIDDGNSSRGVEDTYGISGWIHDPLVSLVTSSGIRIADRDSDGYYTFTYENSKEKMITLIDKIMALYNSEDAYFWTGWNVPKEQQVDFAEGNSLFQLYATDELVLFRDKDIRFGILPYPMYDEDQEDYRTLIWSGMMAVPTTIQNPEMVGEVLELLAYYAPPVKVAYFEDLLSAKLSEAPDDAEMLDLLWNTQVGDVGMLCCNISHEVASMTYMLPIIVSEETTNTYSSYMKKNTRAAQKSLDQFFKQGNYDE